MATNYRKPPTKLTVGAQYICFNRMDENNDWTQSFEDTVYQLPTVTNVEVSDNTDAYDTYASGDVYESDAAITGVEISETNIAFPDDLLERMRGNDVDDGVVLGGGIGMRPYFAYGFVVKKRDNTMDLRWYPKCKLTDNSDKTETSEESHKDQTDDLTIKAYGFDEKSHKYVRALTAEEGMQDVTEEAFFAAPLLTAAAVKALVSETPGE